jgi:hypothetical protein
MGNFAPAFAQLPLTQQQMLGKLLMAQGQANNPMQNYQQQPQGAPPAQPAQPTMPQGFRISPAAMAQGATPAAVSDEDSPQVKAAKLSLMQQQQAQQGSLFGLGGAAAAAPGGS